MTANKQPEEILPEHFDPEVELLFVTEREKEVRAEMERRVMANEMSTQEYDDADQLLQARRLAAQRRLRQDQRGRSWFGKLFRD